MQVFRGSSNPVQHSIFALSGGGDAVVLPCRAFCGRAVNALLLSYEDSLRITIMGDLRCHFISLHIIFHLSFIIQEDYGAESENKREKKDNK